MDDDRPSYDAFRTDDLWKPSTFFQDPSTYESSLFTPLQLDVPSIKLDNPYAPHGPLDHALALPDIDSFEFGLLPEIESAGPSLPSLDTPPLEEDDDDLWGIALELGPANKDVTFFSWENFEQPGFAERHTPYITESGPEALDAALVKDSDSLPAGRVLKGSLLLESLWNLGLGRSSILFQWDAKGRTFVPAMSEGRASGFSLPSAQSLAKYFTLTGNTFVYLRSFVERTFASPTSIPARVALATCISSILSSFEDHLGRHSNAIRSLLQLQHLFSKPREIVLHVARIVDAVKHATSNEQLSSILHHRVMELEEGDESLRRLSAEILCRVSQPSLELIGEWIGIRSEQETVPIANRGSFVGIEIESDDQRPSEYEYRPDMMPRYVAPEDGNTIFETGNSLRFLKHHHPGHPLSALDKYGVHAPKMEWKFGWQDIETITDKARQYEEELRLAILEFSRGTLRPRKSPVKIQPEAFIPALPDGVGSQEEIGRYFEATAKIFDGAPQQFSGSLPDEFQYLISQLLSDSSTSELTQSFSPPMSLSSTLSFQPLLTAQAKLVNASTMRLFFRSHQLRMHLSLQRQYQLLGDGVFSSRLASALFDPERESAERHKGTMRSGVQMGLQLGSRSNWPPASSELRLALMGVLSESYYSSALYHAHHKDANHHHKEKGELPGQLNFAVRQLTEPEMEKIMDPDSLYALDFLRLQYVPPSPLNLVISAAALDKYDTIFKFLLRLLRMLFVVSHLPRDYANVISQKFRMEAHHFVTAISSYIFQTGIAEHWTAFESYISTVETRLADEDAAGELGTRVTSGLEALKSAHEECLDSIMFSLLLRRRQRKVMTLVEEIFDHILHFAKLTRDEDSDAQADVTELYAKLRGKIRVFLSVCRGLTGKRGYGKGKGTSEENTLERLGVSLEMNGYFSNS